MRHDEHVGAELPSRSMISRLTMPAIDDAMLLWSAGGWAPVPVCERRGELGRELRDFVQVASQGRETRIGRCWGRRTSLDERRIVALRRDSAV